MTCDGNLISLTNTFYDEDDDDENLNVSESFETDHSQKRSLLANIFNMTNFFVFTLFTLLIVVPILRTFLVGPLCEECYNKNFNLK